ncbi:hypothetical protein LEMLEM_LOCUS1411, partial [Lemmus lemmus]
RHLLGLRTQACCPSKFSLAVWFCSKVSVHGHTSCGPRAKHWRALPFSFSPVKNQRHPPTTKTRRNQ